MDKIISAEIELPPTFRICKLDKIDRWYPASTVYTIFPTLDTESFDTQEAAITEAWRLFLSIPADERPLDLMDIPWTAKYALEEPNCLAANADLIGKMA